MGGVAFFAHIGGFLVGVVLAVITSPKKKIAKNTPFLTED
jgi:membrane associated rhomboid family serine protease